ncbi:MAG: hypothetical protein WCG66_12420 [bacterium]
MNYLKRLALIAVLATCGCAAIEKADRAHTEKLLAAAGFKVVSANTPARQAALQSMPAYKIERKLRGDDVFYTFACPDQNIAYIGNQENFSKYRELEIQEEIALRNTVASENDMLAAQQWNDWRVWGPTDVLSPPRLGGR